jgi:hypothetical protein
LSTTIRTVCIVDLSAGTVLWHRALLWSTPSCAHTVEDCGPSMRSAQLCSAAHSLLCCVLYTSRWRRRPNGHCSAFVRLCFLPLSGRSDDRRVHVRRCRCARAVTPQRCTAWRGVAVPVGLRTESRAVGRPRGGAHALVTHCSTACSRRKGMGRMHTKVRQGAVRGVRLLPSAARRGAAHAAAGCGRARSVEDVDG